MDIATETREVQPPARHRSLVSAVLASRCPQCREGDFFVGPWHSTKLLHIHTVCPVCNAKFEPEPGFFIGAMYVNYAFNILQLIIVGLFMWLVVNPSSAWWIVGAVLGVTFLTIPFTARTSRVIWMYMFGELSYKPGLAGR
jgi:uncharacterized protein (DUF983 family)